MHFWHTKNNELHVLSPLAAAEITLENTRLSNALYRQNGCELINFSIHAPFNCGVCNRSLSERVGGGGRGRGERAGRERERGVHTRSKGNVFKTLSSQKLKALFLNYVVLLNIIYKMT